MKEDHVIDANVLLISKGQHEAGYECSLACDRALKEAEENRVLIDDDRLIEREYRKYFGEAPRQQTPGHRFYKWLLQNQKRPDRCLRVKITPKPSDSGPDFEEFPRDKDLESFDNDDRKFVAVALASNTSPSILVASDRGWWRHRDALKANGVRVCFLCPDYIKKSRRPQPRRK